MGTGADESGPAEGGNVPEQQVGYWGTYVAIWIPNEAGPGDRQFLALERFLKEELGFRDTDWCDMRNDTGARASYGPCDEPPSQLWGEEF